MRTGSNRALARALGVSETAVRKAEKAGRIRRAGDGSWEVERVRAAWRANTDAGQQRAPVPRLTAGPAQGRAGRPGADRGAGVPPRAGRARRLAAVAGPDRGDPGRRTRRGGA